MRNEGSTDEVDRMYFSFTRVFAGCFLICSNLSIAADFVSLGSGNYQINGRVDATRLNVDESTETTQLWFTGKAVVGASYKRMSPSQGVVWDISNLKSITVRPVKVRTAGGSAIIGYYADEDRNIELLGGYSNTWFGAVFSKIPGASMGGLFNYRVTIPPAIPEGSTNSYELGTAFNSSLNLEMASGVQIRASNRYAVLWERALGAQDKGTSRRLMGLRDWPNYVYDIPWKMTRDGEFIAGESADMRLYGHAVVWKRNGELRDLGYFKYSSYATARGLSDDGNTVCGWGFGADGIARPFTWRDDGAGLKAMPLLENAYDAGAFGCSPDGKLLVGIYDYEIAGNFFSAAFVSYDSVAGNGTGKMYDLKQLLLDQGVPQVAGWSLTMARDAVILENGKALVTGFGLNPEGQYQGYVAEIDLDRLPGGYPRGNVKMGPNSIHALPSSRSYFKTERARQTLPVGNAIGVWN